jgi:hypothetical protein
MANILTKEDIEEIAKNAGLIISPNSYSYSILSRRLDKPSLLLFSTSNNRGKKDGSDYRINLNTGECTASSPIQISIPIKIKQKLVEHRLQSLSIEDVEEKFVEKPIERKSEKKQKNIPSLKRIKIWRNEFENFVGICLCCHNELQFENFHVGHIKSRATGGTDEEDNLAPICQSCNMSMRDTNMIEYQKLHYPNNYANGRLKNRIKDVPMDCVLIEQFIEEFTKINNMQMNVNDKYILFRETINKIIEKKL